MSNSDTPDDWSIHAPLVMVSNLCIGQNREKVRFIFREEANNPHDSGWVFFCGFEPPGYNDNPENFSICPLESILEVEPSLEPLLDSPVGSAWEMPPESSKWVKVDDFTYDDA